MIPSPAVLPGGGPVGGWYTFSKNRYEHVIPSVEMLALTSFPGVHVRRLLQLHTLLLSPKITLIRALVVIPLVVVALRSGRRVDRRSSCAVGVVAVIRLCTRVLSRGMSSRRSTLRPTSSSERLKALATATTCGNITEEEED